MHTFEFTQKDLKGTLLLNALDAKRHFLINSHFKTLLLTANAEEKKEIKKNIVAIKKLKELLINVDEFQKLSFDLIDNAQTDEKFVSFSNYFNHKNLEKLKALLTEIIETINPRALFVDITTTQGSDSFTNDDGVALRESISLTKANSPITVNWGEGITKKNGVYVYIMVLDNSF